MVKIQTKMKTKPKGLINSGNNCFVNSVLQCIINHKNISIYFLNTEFKSNEKYSLSFKEFIKNYEKEELIKSPNQLINKLKEKINILNGEMQDANEFLILFIDLLINEKVIEPKIISKKFLKEFNENKILTLFSGLKNFISICSICNKETNRYELFRILMINEQSIQESIRNYFNFQNLVFTCENCNKLSSKLKTIDILFMPEVLPVVVNRFLSLTEKNNKNIIIEESLKIQRFNYNLFGLVCHKGSLISGHYTSYVKISGIWFHFDDEIVTKVNPELFSSSVYLAFYSRTLI